MIASFKHRGLKRLYEKGGRSGIGPNMLPKVEEILAILEAAETIEAIDIPGYRLHPLTGSLKGFWSVRVTGNWRIVFRFVRGEAYDVDLVDYHQEGLPMPMKNPVHPGRIIRGSIEELGLTVTAAARMLNVTRPTLSTLLNGKSGISPEMAVRLAKTIGSTPAFWLRLQMNYDLAEVEKRADSIIVNPVDQHQAR